MVKEDYLLLDKKYMPFEFVYIISSGEVMGVLNVAGTKLDNSSG